MRLLPVIGFLFLISCTTDVVTPFKMGYEYQVYEVGQERIYSVQHITIDDFFDPPKLDTTLYQLKEVVADTFYDNEGRLSYRLERFKKMFQDSIDYDSLDWDLTDVWYGTLTDRRFEKVEENIRFVRLNFPVEEGRSWDGNALNTENSWEYEYQEVHVPGSISGLNFDSTCFVMQANDTNLIERRYAYEIFAVGVGLIKKELKDVKYAFPEGNLESGVIISQELVDFTNP